MTKPYRWSSIEFSGRYPKIWAHPKNRIGGTPDGIPIVFESLADLHRLVYTLQGAISIIDREEKEARAKRKARKKLDSKTTS